MESSPKQPSGPLGPDETATPAVPHHGATPGAPGQLPDRGLSTGPAAAGPGHSGPGHSVPGHPMPGRPPAGPADPAGTGPAGPEQVGGSAVPGQRTPPHAAPPPPAPVRPARRVSKLRLVLAVAGGVLALLCLGGVGLGIVLYREATEPDRSAPDVAVDNYLRALLVDHNDIRSAEMRCTSPQLAEIETLASDIQAQERRLGTSISVTWGALRVETDDSGAATVDTLIRRSATVDGAAQSLRDDWRFRVVDEGGWRVCGAERVP